MTALARHVALPADPDGRPTYRPDHEEFLRHLDTAVTAHVRNEEPYNTRRGYAADWRRWLAFTASVQVDPRTVRESLLATFVLWLAQTKQAPPNTINRNLTGATRYLRDLHGIEVVPVGITKLARRALRNYRRQCEVQGLALGRGEAPAMSIEHLRQICAAQPQDTLAGVRNRALLMVQFGMAGRQSEPGSLLVNDVIDCGNFLDINLRFGKTGGRQISIARGASHHSDAVEAWRRWREASGITAGPAFRPINRHGTLGSRSLTGWGVNDIIIGATAKAGIDVHYTGHSLRAGLISEAWLAGVDDKTITDQSGHVAGSAQVHRYKRDVDRHKRNATTGLL